MATSILFQSYVIEKAGIVWVDPTSHNIPTLIGIQSFSGACGYAAYPDVFGRVTHVLDWITEKTSK